MNRTQSLAERGYEANISTYMVFYTFIVLGFAFVGPLVSSSDWVSSSDFHSCIEIFGSLIAVIAGFASLVYYFGTGSRFYLIVGLGFFLCGSEDLIQGIVGFERLFEGSSIDLSGFLPGTYAAGRLSLVIMIIIAALLETRLKPTLFIKQEAVLFISIAALVSSASIALAFSFDFSQLMYPESTISRPIDFFLALIFVFAFYLIGKRFLAKRDIFSGMLLACILLNIGGLIYMSFSKQLFDAYFDVAHWAKALSYFMPVVGVTIHSLNEMERSGREAADRRRAEERLQQANKYKSEFMANMSHELRTPLNSLLILAQDLAANRKGNLDEGQVESANIVYKSGNDLLMLINDILDLARIEAGKMPVNVEPVYFDEIVDGINSSFKHIAQQKNLQLNINLSYDLPQTIQTDRQKLQQVLKNLISNAIKFTDEGSITVDFYKLPSGTHAILGSQDPQKVIAIAVTDTGVGIPTDKLDAIFEAFQQVDGSISRQYEGTGLGLSISKETVELLGGNIRLESKVGYGSTFTVYLPEVGPCFEDFVDVVDDLLKKDEDHDGELLLSPECTADNITFSNQKVLLVDDDMRNVFALSRVLEDRGLQIHKAANGKKALEMLDEEPDVDLVLMDIMMPVMDGYEAIRLIREQERFKNLPILALTAKAMTGDREGLKVGVYPI
jgi:signal transduction histidine kinase